MIALPGQDIEEFLAIRVCVAGILLTWFDIDEANGHLTARGDGIIAEPLQAAPRAFLGLTIFSLCEKCVSLFHSVLLASYRLIGGESFPGARWRQREQGC
jgi:hypothetical protein